MTEIAEVAEAAHFRIAEQRASLSPSVISCESGPGVRLARSQAKGLPHEGARACEVSTDRGVLTANAVDLVSDSRMWQRLTTRPLQGL